MLLCFRVKVQSGKTYILSYSCCFCFRVKAQSVKYILRIIPAALFQGESSVGKVHPESYSCCFCFRVKAQSVKYILLFLYGAMVEVPISDITSVIQASDMFGVEGLKEWLCFQIARDFCHFFHKVGTGTRSSFVVL